MRSKRSYLLPLMLLAAAAALAPSAGRAAISTGSFPAHFSVGFLTFRLIEDTSHGHSEETVTAHKVRFVRTLSTAQEVDYTIDRGDWIANQNAHYTFPSDDCTTEETFDMGGEGAFHGTEDNGGVLRFVPPIGRFFVSFSCTPVRLHHTQTGCPGGVDETTDITLQGGFTGQLNTDANGAPSLDLNSHTVQTQGDVTDTFDSAATPGLAANAGGPYTCVRGSSAQLDGSNSRGAVSYKWTFQPIGGGKTPNEGNKTGASPSITCLDSIQVTLTATDDNGASDTDTTAVAVTKRTGSAWKTAFERADEEELTTEKAPSLAGWVGGESRCAYDPDEPYNPHNLHPDKTDGTWEGGGYTVQAVSDPDGPFDGWYYISEYKLKVRRNTMVNQYLLPGGPPIFANGKSFYAGNQAAARQKKFKKFHINVAKYLAAVRAHEVRHGTLVQQALAKNDPGPALEALFDQDRIKLRHDLADKKIEDKEAAITAASDDPLKQTWDGFLVVPNASGKYQQVETTVGVPGGK